MHSEDAIMQSIKIAENHQANITFFSVIEAPGSRHTIFHTKHEYNKYLKELVPARTRELEERISKFSTTVDTRVEAGTGIGFIEIIKRVIQGSHDLVVKRAGNYEWLDRFFTSEDMHLLRKCPCPVLLLKSGKKDNFHSILATVDVDDDASERDQTRAQTSLNKAVLEYSASFCTPELTELHIGSAWEASAEDFLRYSTFSHLSESEVDSYVESDRRQSEEKLASLLEDMKNSLGAEAMQYMDPQVHLVKGEASKMIPNMVEEHDIDLIVMGTVGRVGIPGFIIGNTAEAILQQLKCSVLAIKPEGFQTPVA